MNRTVLTVLVEACCDSLHTATAAQQFGAGRIELCGDGDGGTTPSPSLIASCRAAVSIPLHIMIRPHTVSFQYADADVAVMLASIAVVKSLGADGVVFGPLRHDHTVHEEQLALLVDASRPMCVAFHRAFDRTPDAIVALDALLAAGVDYVLTSGHGDTALAGADMLRTLQQRAGDQLTVLAGGSVRGGTVAELVDRSHVREVHARSTDPTIVRDVVLALAARAAG